MQAPSEEEEEFHSVSLLFSFRLFVPNRPLFSMLILLFSAKTPEGRPRGSMCAIPHFPLADMPVQIKDMVSGFVCVSLCACQYSTYL